MRGEGVPIGHEVKALVFVLELQPILQRAEIVA
jgi:hypothetical protein